MARNKSTDGASDAAPKVKKQRWYHQVWQAYQMTRRTDPSVTWWMLLMLAGGLVVGLLLGLLLGGHWIFGLIMGLPLGLLAAMYTLTRRAESAAYKQIEGQPGAARAALGSVRRGGWSFADEPVAFDARTQDMVFRGVGRPGVLLVSEGTTGRSTRLLDAEKKRTARVLPGVPIVTLEVGSAAGQVPLRKVVSTVQKMRPQMTKAEVAEVSKRLRALGGAKLPIPKGIDPMRARPDRKGMRGR
ncbi:DUF4191 domain-containing protein [Luteimicrobium subarcticum]|uniref:Uncharacterized protein DUF4191 n=1 Tax=Luteimicrobium subarcticum TaxID=620910 RepID=A0A2M8WR96_9MICO|nr:DUF4191 domain-containing protein [Luteimicrobium subarcticum]PJI93461.1 uncharacterized protein DUF4191 [Luteimicrobium subarcticum]